MSAKRSLLQPIEPHPDVGAISDEDLCALWPRPTVLLGDGERLPVVEPKLDAPGLHDRKPGFRGLFWAKDLQRGDPTWCIQLAYDQGCTFGRHDQHVVAVLPTDGTPCEVRSERFQVWLYGECIRIFGRTPRLDVWPLALDVLAASVR